MSQGKLELVGYSSEFDSADAAVRALVANHSAEELTRRPANGGWTAAECLNHVAQTAGVYIPLVQAAIEDGHQRGLRGDGPFHYGLLARTFRWLTEPPVRVRVKAPSVFLPGELPGVDEALAAFLARHAELQALLKAAEGLDLAAVKVTSPASSKLILPVGAVFGILTAHARRHLWQARQGLSESGT